MPQVSYTYPNGLAGQVGTYATGDVISIENPLSQQLTNWDVNSGTTDGSYVITATDGRQTVTATFVASSDTAAGIAAGVAAAILADPAFAGAIVSATVVATDQVDILFQMGGQVWTVTYAGPAGPTAPTVTTAAGFTQVAPGIILQSDTAGGFTTAYSDPSICFGVTIKNADLVHPMNNPASATGTDGPAMLSLVRRGEIYVQGTAGIAILKGNAAFFNGTTGTWSNVTTGSHVLVPESMFMTGGTGAIVRVYVNLPSET
jgi:hypothetical protein